MSPVAEYNAMLDRYHHMIFALPWWNGLREMLCREMDPLWWRMSDKQRQECYDYASKLYFDRINQVKGVSHGS